MALSTAINYQLQRQHHHHYHLIAVGVVRSQISLFPSSSWLSIKRIFYCHSVKTVQDNKTIYVVE